MSTMTIGKAQINQRCIRESVEIQATGKWLSLQNVKGVPTLYFENWGETYPIKVRAFLTDDTVNLDDFFYIGTLTVWGLTLHFFRDERPT